MHAPEMCEYTGMHVVRRMRGDTENNALQGSGIILSVISIYRDSFTYNIKKERNTGISSGCRSMIRAGKERNEIDD